MGQRHQLFVIARIYGRYRCLSAIHHHWLAGETALKRCLGTLKIFSDPANGVPLEQELIAAQRCDEGFWTATRAEYFTKNSHVPFPFIATCLITGASFGADEGYYQRVSIKPFYMAYNQGDNNNGITIFDITEPSNVRYCFVDYHGTESERPVQLMTPLTARIYLEAYYKINHISYSRNLLPLLDEFKEWDIIAVATLQDTWPKGEWEELESNEGSDEEMTAPELVKLEINTPDTSKSLRNRAMATVLQTLLEGPDEISGILLEAELLTDFMPKLKTKLYEQANTLKPSPHLVDLLCRALADNTHVDLGPFTTLSAEDMSLVVSRLRKHGKMDTLCVSNRSDLTERDMQIVLGGAAGLKALYILEDPQITAQGMCSLLDDCDLYHSDLLRRSIKPQPDRFHADAVSARSDDAMPAGQICGYNNVSQLVWIGITAGQATHKSHRLGNGLIDWESLRQGDPQSNSNSSSYLKYQRYSLNIPLPTFKTVAGLLRLLKWGSSARPDIYVLGHFSKGAAFSFAMASTIPGDKDSGVDSVGGGNGFGIGPLESTLYMDDLDDTIPAHDALEHLEPGRWAIILIHEAFDARSQNELDEYRLEVDSARKAKLRALASRQDQPLQAIKRLRYALVTPSTEPNGSDRDYMVADIPTFLENINRKSQGNSHTRVPGLTEAWNSRIAAMDTVDFYGEDDIHEILPKVFPRQKVASSGSKP